MPGLYRWNGSSWVQVPDGNALKYWNGSAWVNPNALKYWNGTSWVTAWNKSDPQTLTVTADFTSTVRYNSAGYYSWDPTGSNADDTIVEPRVGRFNGSQPYHYGAILGFPMSSIITALGTRPNIVSARTRMYRLSGSGLGTASGTMRIGTWTQNSWRSTPSINNIANYTDFAPLASEVISAWTYPSYQWMDIDPQHVTDLVNGRALFLAEITTGWNSSGGTTNLYSKFAGIETGSNLPELEVTIDY